VLEPMVSEARQARIREALAGRLMSVTVLLDRPHDPHNGAAVMRSCDAFGLQSVHVIPSEEEFLASNLVAKGAGRWLDVTTHATPDAAITALRAANYDVITTHPKGQLEPEQLAELPRVALVLGNEHLGICSELEQSAGRSVRIPMRGFVESLNVSVSAGILLRAACQGRPGDLTESEHRLLYARGLFHSLQRSQQILASLPSR
jgi:tRNA (guanosine-2'-O-)-methyltransferase